MKPLLAYLASIGICNIMYVDDGRTSGATKKKADEDYVITIRVFAKAGLTVAKEKSDKFGNSAQRKEYLGFVIDTQEILCTYLR
jgi:hypothetical protein